MNISKLVFLHADTIFSLKINPKLGETSLSVTTDLTLKCALFWNNVDNFSKLIVYLEASKASSTFDQDFESTEKLEKSFVLS